MDGHRWVAAVVILLVILGGSIVFTGLLVGSFVDKAQQTSRKRSEALRFEIEKRRAEIRISVHEALVSEFGTGDVGINEIITFTNSQEDVVESLQELDITPDEVCTLLKSLDPNGMEHIPVTKVSVALERLRAPGRGRDLLELQSTLSNVFVGTGRIEKQTHDLNRKLLSIQETVDKVHLILSRTECD